jgi:hypothetical protein
MMDVIVDFLPELVTLVVAVAVAVARTTDNKIDDKVARLAEKHESKLTGAVKRLVQDDKAKK